MNFLVEEHKIPFGSSSTQEGLIDIKGRPNYLEIIPDPEASLPEFLSSFQNTIEKNLPLLQKKQGPVNVVLNFTSREFDRFQFEEFHKILRKYGIILVGINISRENALSFLSDEFGIPFKFTDGSRNGDNRGNGRLSSSVSDSNSPLPPQSSPSNGNGDNRGNGRVSPSLPDSNSLLPPQSLPSKSGPDSPAAAVSSNSRTERKDWEQVVRSIVGRGARDSSAHRPDISADRGRREKEARNVEGFGSSGVGSEHRPSLSPSSNGEGAVGRVRDDSNGVEFSLSKASLVEVRAERKGREQAVRSGAGEHWSERVGRRNGGTPSGEGGTGERAVHKVMRTCRAGTSIYFEGDVVIFGDLNAGAEVRATGDIIVLGSLRGMAHAGCKGDQSAKIFAADLSPMQLRLADQIAISPPDETPRQRQRIALEMAYLNAEKKIEVKTINVGFREKK